MIQATRPTRHAMNRSTRRTVTTTRIDRVALAGIRRPAPRRTFSGIPARVTGASTSWSTSCVQWWFFSNYGECFAGNVKVETPEEFAAYDPALNELIGRVFNTHRIPMDVFHGKSIRPVKCGS